MNYKNIKTELIKRDGERCCICGRNFDERCVPQIDHIIPKSLDGTDDIDNLQLVCARCNIIKSNKLIYTEIFEKYIKKMILLSDKYEIIDAQEHKIDLLLKDKKKEEYLVCEINYNTVFTDDRIAFISEILKEKSLFIEKKYKKVKSAIIFPGILSQKYMDFLRTSGIEIWDKDYLVSQFKEEMLQIDNPYINSLFRIFGAKTKQTKNIYQEKIDKLKKCKPGRENCYNYQRLIGEILELLFCPDLCTPISEKSDYKKINRRDYVMPNYDQSGFWNFMRQNYLAHIVVIDAKNSNVGVKKQDILQMANYLNKHRSRLIWNYYC